MNTSGFILFFVIFRYGYITTASEVSRVEVDLDRGLVTGYSDRVQFLTTPSLPNGYKPCRRQAVLRLNLGGQIQIAKLSLKYANPQLWTFHLSDSQMADVYGDIFLRMPNTSSTTELYVSNQQLRIYTHFPPSSVASSWGDIPQGSDQWMYLRVVDDTVHKGEETEVTLDLNSNTIRWQDGRLARDFTAPPGLFDVDGQVKSNIVIYVSVNRVLDGEWRAGTGLCHMTVKLMDSDEDQCGGVPIDCDPNAVCKKSRQFHRCSCRKGWEGDGKTCRDIDECRLRNGGCVHTCHNSPGSYSCSCLRGFETDADDSHNCVDVDECHTSLHGCQQQCVNTVGSYECQCDANLTTPARRHCQHEDSPCFQHGCQHTCFAGQYGNVVKCSCWSDHLLNATDKKSCIRKCRLGNGGCQHHCLDTDVEPVCTCQYRYLLGFDGRICTASCSVNNGGCQKRCSNTDVGVLCSCPNGYMLNSDGKTCSDVDECADNNGGCQHECLNGVGYFECTCPRGYKIDPADEKTCLDVDECSVNETCEHACINSPGSYRCACREGFQLFGTTHCGDIDECFIANGGCSEACINTEGGFHCSHSNYSHILPEHLDKCLTDNTTEIASTRGRIALTGISCSHVPDMKGYAKDFFEKLRNKLSITCELHVINVRCLLSKDLEQISDKQDVVKVGFKMICAMSDISKDTGIYNNCTLKSSAHTLWQTVSLLKDSFNKDPFSIKVHNLHLSVVHKSFHVKQGNRRQGYVKIQNDTNLTEISNNGNKQILITNNFHSNMKKLSQKCSSGTFWDEISNRCEACLKGTYLNENKTCSKCPGNSTTDIHEAHNIESCKRFECRSYINDLKGFIESPNYPGNYPNNVECTWIIKPPKGRRLLIIIPEIYIAGNKCEDQIMMRKSKSVYSVITFEACKSVTSPLAFISQSKRLWIRFQSDNMNNAMGFHIPFVTYNEEYQTLIEDIVQDRRLYSSQNHLEILRDKKLLEALLEVIAQPINYYKYSNEQRKMFPSSFIRLMTPKVRKFFSYRRKR